MPIGENAEDRARNAINAKDPKQGQEMQQVQALQSSIQEIQGERRNNLMAARVGAEGDARENQAMLQAAEMGMLGGAGAVAVENATPVQQTSPQTQAILSKYGVGKPKNQTTTTRSVQQTPTKITINNNTTNNTTNNVAIPPSNVGGPVQGRTLAIRQQPDQGQARFKTWINNAFARQNQAAAQREKEYQRREWSLSRTTGKLMKKLQELGTTISERMDPRKIASSATNHFKTLLFLFGTMFLAKNWKKIISIGASIERFFWGEVISRDENGKVTSRGEPGWKGFVRDLFGAKEGQPIGDAIRGFFWNDSTSETGKDAGIFNILLKKLKDYFSEGAAAVKSLELPKLDLDDVVGSVKALVGYLGNVLSALFTGGEGLKGAIDTQVKEAGNRSKYGFNSEGKDASWIKDRTDINKKFTNYKVQDVNKAYGIDSNDNNIAYGDLIHSRDKDSANYLRYIDLDKDDNLTGTIGSGFRASNSVVSMLRDKDTVNTVGVTSMLGKIETAVKKGEANGGNGLAIESDKFFSTTGLTPQDIEELKKNGDIREGKFKYVVREKTQEELAQEYKGIDSESPSPEMAAINAGIRTELENVTGIGTLKKIGWTLLGTVGGLALCLTPGGQAIGIPLMMTAGGLAGMATGALSQNTAVRAGLAYALNTKKAKVIPRYKIELVPADDPRPGLKLNKFLGIDDTTSVAEKPEDQTIVDGFWIKSGVINKIKDRIGGFKTKDAEGNEIYKSFDITDAEVRKHMDDFTRSTQMQLHGKVAENVDYDLTNYEGIKKLEELKEQHKKEQAEMWNNSPLKRSVDYVTEGVSNAVSGVKNYVFGENKKPDYKPLSTAQQKENAKKVVDFFTSKGFTTEQAAGVAGVWHYESEGINPSSYNKKAYAENPNGNYDRGIAQWQGSRVPKFKEWIKAKYGDNRDITDLSLEDQLEYAWKEMNERPAFIKALKEAPNVEYAVDAVLRGFENGSNNALATPAQIDAVPGYRKYGNTYKKMMEARVPRALGIYNQLLNIDENQQTPQEDSPTTQPDASGVYLAQNNTEEPENYVELPKDGGSSSNYKVNWNEVAGTQSWGGNSDALAMANEAAKTTVTPDSSKLVQTGGRTSIPSTGKTAETIVTSSNASGNTDKLLADISGKLNNLSTLTAAASDQQVQATMGVAQAIGNIQIIINTNQGSKIMRSSQTGSPYNES